MRCIPKTQSRPKWPMVQAMGHCWPAVGHSVQLPVTNGHFPPHQSSWPRAPKLEGPWAVQAERSAKVLGLEKQRHPHVQVEVVSVPLGLHVATQRNFPEKSQQKFMTLHPKFSENSTKDYQQGSQDQPNHSHHQKGHGSREEDQ